jgi:hypothetical protein
MLRRTLARLVWVVLVAAVLNGLVGLGLAALRAAGIVSGSWLAVLSPLWVPLAVAVVLELALLQIIWTCTSSTRSRREGGIPAGSR